jgi:hypothetical protein
VDKHILDKLSDENYKLLGYPNQYSMFLNSYGSNFYMPKQMQVGNDESKSHFGFSVFGLWV